ncbi:MAG TPA: hypothetical protein QGF58_26280 [Myxococcota bacterium]|nr:hypothetical protein [Myxococcota bacterium]
MVLLLFACKADPSGVWLFHLAETPDAEDCATTVSHDFVGAGLPGEDIDESEWQISETATWSESSLFGLVSALSEGYTLLLDGRIYTSADGATFTHSRASEDDESWIHPSGYQWSSSASASLEMTVTANLEEGWSGTWSSVDSTIEDYEESDGWSEEIGIGTTGQIPSDDHLVEEDDTGTEVPVSNLFEEIDCADDPCQLSISTDCSIDWSLSAELTSLTAEDFEAVAGYETDAGY